jgi:hypothetical protein
VTEAIPPNQERVPELAAELAALLDMGVVLGQGRFFTAPELVPAKAAGRP